MDETEKAIIEYLRKNGKSCVKDIADGMDKASATVSKYLLVLLSNNKVRKEVKRPYIYYEAVQ